jgi:hypothetical protein
MEGDMILIARMTPWLREVKQGLLYRGWLGTIARGAGALCAIAALSLVLGGGVARAQATNVYLAQTAAGAANGSSCANARAYGYFNTAANWGTGSTQIGPGTTVHLCGTITDSLNGTLLTAQGNGASGNPVTIHFETGAILQSPAETTFINGGNHSYFIIDGGTTCGWINQAEVACNGLIQNTLNGYSGMTCPGGSCAHQVSTQMINNFNSNLEVRNLTIGPVYIHGGTSDTTFTAPGPKCVDFTTGGGNINIHNNIMHDAGWCLNGGGNSITVANTEIYNSDHGMGMGQYTDTPNTWTGVTVHDSYIHNNGMWDQSNNAFHHDGIHLFSYCGTNVGGNNTYCPKTIITGVNIYNVMFGGNWGSNNTANIFFEGNIENANLFNNVTVVYAASQLNNGQYNGYGTNVNFFNNTVLGPGTAYQTIKYSIFNGPGIAIENNVWTDGGMISTSGPFPVGGASGCPYTLPSGAGGGTQPCLNLTYSLKTNAYLAPADFGNGFGYTLCVAAVCTGNGFLNFNASGFASFESLAPEKGGVFRDTTQPIGTWLNATTGAELSASPTIGAGTNLSALCIQNGGSLPNALCSDITGNPRPLTGAWDIGAYQYAVTTTSTSGPAAPTGLTATAH